MSKATSKTTSKNTDKEAPKSITGEISINTQNILPIIKKWLYSDYEIFLRELVSNAFDAITKLKKIANTENLESFKREGKINIQVDENAKTITISDNGLGMTSVEIQKYINQIAFSGAEDFAKKFKEKSDKTDKADKSDIIGHFGLGFYSAFMVADKVEIKSKSYQENTKAIHWECDGSTQFSIKAIKKDEVGTDVILNINEDQKEFLAVERIKTLVKKYSNFLPVEISVNGEVVNDQNPLWIKSPSDVTEEEYIAFYQKLYPFAQKPLFWIHLNVDYPFNLQGILYFPKITQEIDPSRGQIQLFCQQVFVTDNAKEVVPEFLTLLKGAIDCPDIPLNVSRSMLQNDPYVQKISKHIVKKVSDKLVQLHKNEFDSFKEYWNDIHPFIKYGMMHNDDFYKKVKDVVLFKSSNGDYTTIPDYVARNKAKLDQKVLYCSDEKAQASYIQMAKDHGLEVIYIHTLIDSHFLQFLESKDSTIKFEGVDSNLTQYLADEEASKSDDKQEVVDKDDKKVESKLVAMFKDILKDDQLKIESKKLKSDTIPAMFTESEHSKRFKAMSAMLGQNMPMFNDHSLVINENSTLVKHIEDHSKKGHREKVELLCQHVYDLARMSQKPLEGEDLQKFIARSQALLKEI